MVKLPALEKAVMQMLLKNSTNNLVFAEDFLQVFPESFNVIA
jgi:hypothetical protein